jgi:hypothetical protein
MRPLAQVTAVLVAAGVTLTACGAGATPDDTPSARASPTGAAFYDPSSPPPPEGTVTPPAAAFAQVHPPAGWRVVLLTAGSTAQTATVVGAVRAWAAAEHVRLTTVRAADADDLVPAITRAVKLAPDLVVSAGDDLVDPLASVSAGVLRQQFLVVGAEIAEPTQNVTAADWTGASFRGEGLGRPSTYDPASFTPARAGRAVRAGVAAVVKHLSGIVVWVS